jgi:hypothetical protein
MFSLAYHLFNYLFKYSHPIFNPGYSVDSICKNLDLLFLYSLNTCRHTRERRELSKRLVNKEKRKKLALIAVSNKLLKHCSSMAKSCKPYDETYVSVLAK